MTIGFENGGRPPVWFLNFQNFNGQHVGGSKCVPILNFVAIPRTVDEM